MLVKLGFSGSIATGKTARCNHLATCLAPTYFARVRLLSADAVGHRTYLPGTDVYEQLIATFGAGILDPSTRLPPVPPANGGVLSSPRHLPIINRRALGDIVFRDPSALSSLNSIVWPALRRTISHEITTFETKVRLKHEAANIAGRVSSGANTNSNFSNNANIIICEAALLTEAGLDDLFDEVWLLGCDPEEAIRRVVRRDGLNEAQARSRVAAQTSLSERQQGLEAKGFITSTPGDNRAYLSDAVRGPFSHADGAVESVYNQHKRILRTFDTSRHARLADGLAEIDEGFSAMLKRWVPPPQPSP